MACGEGLGALPCATKYWLVTEVLVLHVGTAARTCPSQNGKAHLLCHCRPWQCVGCGPAHCVAWQGACEGMDQGHHGLAVSGGLGNNMHYRCIITMKEQVLPS